MAGPETNIHIALMARVELMEAVLSMPVAYPGVEFTNTAGDYLRAEHLPNEPFRWGVDGNSPMDRMGFLQLDLFTVIDGGSWQVLAISQAEDIADWFPRDLRLTSGGVTVQLRKTWPQRGRKDPDGTHWHTPIRVEYRATA